MFDRKLTTTGVGLLALLVCLLVTHASAGPSNAQATVEPPPGDCWNRALEPLQCYILEEAQRDGVIEIDADFLTPTNVLHVYLNHPLQDDPPAPYPYNRPGNDTGAVVQEDLRPAGSVPNAFPGDHGEDCTPWANPPSDPPECSTPHCKGDMTVVETYYYDFGGPCPSPRWFILTSFFATIAAIQLAIIAITVFLTVRLMRRRRSRE